MWFILLHFGMKELYPNCIPAIIRLVKIGANNLFGGIMSVSENFFLFHGLGDVCEERVMYSME